jgi:hypothetical protein
MSTPVSQPVVPAQPDLLAYGIQALGLFTTYTRATYFTAFGVQAPAWDPSRVTKTWFDSTVDTSSAANVALYNIVSVDSTGTWGLAQMLIPATEAASVNLPGSVTYPQYTIAPTATSSGGALVDAVNLSLEADAQALMTSLGGNSLVAETGNAVFPILYPPDEPRRIWDFDVNGNLCNAGTLLAAMNANGVGAPGDWQNTPTGPVWVSEPAPTGLDDTRPARPMPVRDLLPNEVFQTGLMGVGIVRTDLAQQQSVQAGQFTPDDRATLQQIYQMVGKLV